WNPFTSDMTVPLNDTAPLPSFNVLNERVAIVF
ncbi:MAG: hypothetical protein PWQ47_65, partial [Methanothermococcus sp.]|nr:hypothetical protein [Methanothermococcus sp.]